MIDLTATFLISSLVLQADHANEFRIESSNDAQSWALLATFPTVSGSGLTTRTAEVSGQARYVRVYGTAGSGSYSISELQVFTPQAKSACLYDDGANAGENLACGYDGQFLTEVVPTAPAPDSNGRLPVSFFLKEAQIIIVCENAIGQHQAFEFQSATNRNCNDNLAVSQAAVTDYCAGFCATGSTPALMSYAQLPDGQFEFDPNKPQVVALLQ